MKRHFIFCIIGLSLFCCATVALANPGKRQNPGFEKVESPSSLESLGEPPSAKQKCESTAGLDEKTTDENQPVNAVASDVSATDVLRTPTKKKQTVSYHHNCSCCSPEAKHFDCDGQPTPRSKPAICTRIFTKTEGGHYRKAPIPFNLLGLEDLLQLFIHKHILMQTLTLLSPPRFIILLNCKVKHCLDI